MDPKSRIGQHELQYDYIIDVLDRNCLEQEKEFFLRRTKLARQDETYTILEFFNILSKYKFHWTNKTPGRIKDEVHKFYKKES